MFLVETLLYKYKIITCIHTMKEHGTKFCDAHCAGQRRVNAQRCPGQRLVTTYLLYVLRLSHLMI